MPGRSASILYWPVPSVTADRTFSISAGLAASTVTPGSTAPDVSFTVPAMALVCADATAGRNASRRRREHETCKRAHAPFLH